MPTEEKIKKNFQNSETVISIENNARNNIKYTLDVFDFMNFRHKDMAPQYKVLKSYLWFAGLEPKKIRDKTFLSRVDIELINEQIKLFYSDQELPSRMTKILLPLLNMFLWVWTIKQVITPRETSPLFWKRILQNRKRALFQPPEFSRKCFIIFTTLTSLC
jgi:hypothetical protein